MDQFELNRAVAEATRESVDTVARLGFSLLVTPATYPLDNRPPWRRYPLRQSPERRPRKPPRRKTIHPRRPHPEINPAVLKSMSSAVLNGRV